RNMPSPQYPVPGAMIDYYLAEAPAGEITLEILDSDGKTVRRFSSAAAEHAVREAEQPAGEEEEGGFRFRGGPVRLDKSAGMHRFTWDLRYAGPWLNKNRPEGPNGPAAVPGNYSVRLTDGAWTSMQPLTIVEDPRISKSGVTMADLQEQFDHNMRVRELVSDVNKTVARVRAAQADLRSASGADAGKLNRLNELASHLITPPIRYSKPELQTHITYLYNMTNMADQKIGRDAIERYGVLRKELDQQIAELNQILGPEQ
ncbi:MAG: hypothetical protein JO211_17220, partial [Acidobacteriaceae bacterium]|nr:hypothetical protein [Acidobacteriaceae bacterium]